MSELREIMDRRRRISDTGASASPEVERLEGSISDLQELQGSTRDFHGSVNSSHNMSSDLQSKLEHRRRLADSAGSGLKIDPHAPMSPRILGSPASAVSSPVKAELKPVAMGSDLQAIMARRRRLTGGDDEGYEGAAAPDPDASPAMLDHMAASMTGSDDPPGEDQEDAGSWKATGHSRTIQDDVSSHKMYDETTLRSEGSDVYPLRPQQSIEQSSSGTTPVPPSPSKRSRRKKKKDEDSSTGLSVTTKSSSRRSEDGSVDGSRTSHSNARQARRSSRRFESDHDMASSVDTGTSGPRPPRRRPSLDGGSGVSSQEESSPSKSVAAASSSSKHRSSKRRGTGGSRSGSDESTGSGEGTSTARRRGTTRRQKSMDSETSRHSASSSSKPQKPSRSKSSASSSGAGGLSSPPGHSSGEDDIVRKPVRKSRSKEGLPTAAKSSRKQRPKPEQQQQPKPEAPRQPSPEKPLTVPESAPVSTPPPRPEETPPPPPPPPPPPAASSAPAPAATPGWDDFNAFASDSVGGTGGGGAGDASASAFGGESAFSGASAFPSDSTSPSASAFPSDDATGGGGGGTSAFPLDTTSSAFPLDSGGSATSAFPSDKGGGGAAFEDAFSKFPSGHSSSGFGNFDESSFPATKHSNNGVTTSTQSFTKPQFDTAFSSAGFSSDMAFDAFGSSDPFGASFDKTAAAPAPPPKKVWDKSPLSGKLPKRAVRQLGLRQKPVFSCKFELAPINNPLNCNVIFCNRRNGEFFLQEVDPRRGSVQVSCIPVVSPEFKRKLAAKFSASVYRAHAVLSIAAGLHQANGQTRTRVAAILDLEVLETQQTLRIVAVWQWGHGSPHPVTLQYLILPPSGADFTFDSSSLQLADGLLFLAGASPKGPCIFMCKPAGKETWSANILGSSGKVASIAVTPGFQRSHPYLAIALDSGSLNVWTYSSALGTSGSRDSAGSKRWLFPLCRLEHGKTFAAINASSPNEEGAVVGRDHKDAGYCTQLEWLPPRSSFSSMLMIAAAFQNGVAVFHVGLPLVKEDSKHGYKPFPEPTQGTGLSQSPLLAPLSACRWQGKYDSSCVSWLDFGPQNGLCLALTLQNADGSNMLFGKVDMPLYRESPLSKDGLLPFRVFASTTVAKESDLFPDRLLRGSGMLSLLSVSESFLMRVTLVDNGTKSSEAFGTALSLPVASQPSGLTSSGDPLLVDAANEKDGVLHVYNVVQCERKVSKADVSMLGWSRPLLRHWLIRTVAGDTKHTAPTVEPKEDRDFGGGDEVVGGAVSDVVCELYHEDLVGQVPFRITRCLGSSLCAIAYRTVSSGDTDITDVSLDATSVVFVDCSPNDEATVMEVVQARDVAFLPRTSDTEEPRGVLLSEDGAALNFFTWEPGSKTCKLGSAFRPVVGVKVDDDFVDCRRFYAFSGAGKVAFAAVGTRPRDGRSCVVLGALTEAGAISDENWSDGLPNIVDDRVCWFEEDEEILSVIGLEGDDSGYRNFAASTSSRVLILSSALTVSAQVTHTEPCSSLAPLGPFAVSYSHKNLLKYLCCLDGKLSSGFISTLPLRKHGLAQNQLLGVRPDRLVLMENHSGTRCVEYGQNPNTFLLPSAGTWPALLLEPLVANAVCVGGKQSQTVPILRTVIEKFGRSVASLTHGDDEGIGNHGAGLTPRVYEILSKYGLRHASSWLLTGSVPFDRGANSTILPPWLPASSKAMGGLNSDAFLHVITNGDQYLSDYVKSPDQNMPSTLPRQSDPAVYLCREYAYEALREGRSSDALKFLDMAGSDSTETTALQLALLLGKDSSLDPTGMLKLISGYNVNGHSRLQPRAPTSIAALATFLKETNKREDEMTTNQINLWMRPLAPSLQQGTHGGRIRMKVAGETDLASAVGKQPEESDPLWVSPCIEAKHVWNEGPRRDKENLLMLDRVEDWIGRRRPLILGKEGVAAAGDRGEKTLADLLNQDDDSFGGKSDLESEKDDWVEGVGEGRSDEANLSAYFRMSEGEDEDSPWSSEGLKDLSPYQNKALIVGDAGNFSLQQSTSSVDEGEPGKVKSLYDLVFDKSGIDIASGLAISAARGSSVDIGVVLGEGRHARKRCSIEFWYYLPSVDGMADEIVLARRTMGAAADDLSKVCIASDKENVLWELCLLKSGILEFRTCSGSTLLSSQNYDPDQEDGDGDDDKVRQDLAVFEKWNHVCLVLSSKDLEVSECAVSIYMKGNEVASSQVSILPSEYDEEDLKNEETLNDIVQKSHILYGLNHSAGFRMTELRIWACGRSADDTQSFLYEYLTAAESKKKFKVKISQKNKGGGLGKGGLLGPPKGGGGPQRGLLATTKSGFLPSMQKSGGSGPSGMSLAPPPKETFSLAPEPLQDAALPAAAAAAAPPPTAENPPASFDPSFGMAFGEQQAGTPQGTNPSGFPPMDQPTIPEDGEYEEDGAVPATLWDTALPLSRQLRSSAAAALMRGPPATRHFGGNRGGLPDFIGMDRFGVGGIAICGSEKTIVWRDNEDPPALTYPIGASGAVVSDQMDDAGSEFLCCFLAKEKRMVVFELQSRSVVVELQMTTKLNFWRYLPPEAAENTLCFILVTPVGGFHWMPLEDSPRPHQVWKRGPDLQGKKVVNYEEGGSNGFDHTEMRSRVGLVTVTKASGNGSLEVWIIPIAGDSKAIQLSADVMGACLCQPPLVETGAFLPLVVTVHHMAAGILVKIMSLMEPSDGSFELGIVETSQMIEMAGFENDDYEPPALAMGTFPEAICCSLSNIFVVIIRRKGVIAAFELEDGDLSLIAQEGVGHYIVDAVMRYSAEVGGAEIVMLLSDNENPKDGRIVSFCFRSAA